jgi:putative addiction module killer protein
MNTIKTTPEFDKWFSSIKDNVTLLRLTHRLKKVAAGNLGDIKPVGEGVWEMREFFGNGWRMYYTQKGDVIILMSTQSRDISQAIALTKLIKE